MVRPPRPVPRSLAVWLGLSLALVAARAQAEGELDEDRGWRTGTIQEQLDRDPTLVPYGKGAIFVPAMTNPLDEPPVAIHQADRERPVAEGTSGSRIVLFPGTYEVSVGSGSSGERLRVQATVREGHTTVIPATWSGLAVHVLNERLTTVRGSYEVIRVDDRQYLGIGFGTDEQAGEPLSTWILRPGLYKIVRVGETYRARRDYTTVRLEPGRLTHFVLVLNEDTGDFIGAGETPEEDLFFVREGLRATMVLGGDVSLSSRSNVPGLEDGVTFNGRGFIDSYLSVELFDSPLLISLQLEEGFTKGLGLPFQKSNDRVDLDLLYVYQIEKWIGPYLRVAAETNLFNGFALFTEPTDVTVLDVNGANPRLLTALDEFKLSPPFGQSILKEGLGLNVRVFKELFGEVSIRSGLGARHRLANDLYEAVPNAPNTYREVDSLNQVGVEATVLGIGRITRWVLLNLEFDTLVPFEGAELTVVELEASAALKLTSFVSVNYVLRYRRDPTLAKANVFEQDLRLRFSVELP